MGFGETLETIGDFLWGTPMIVTIIGCGIIFTLWTKGFTIRYIGHILQNTLFKMGGNGRKENDKKTEGNISAFEAVCIAIGGAVGTGNLGGVAAAIAVGGPGALFWMWVWAFFGMTVKMVEVTLGCYYRQKNEKGEYLGGATYYMVRGIAEDKGFKKIGYSLAWLFGIGFMLQAISSSQMKTVAEALNASFGIPQIPFACAYTAGLMWILWKGKSGIAKFASKTVPAMCLLYVIAGLGIIVINWSNVPSVLAAVFTNAFKPTAAVGGFVGTTVARTIRIGIARAINSNEAGMGSSPMIHASAETPHPVKQGLWGCCEVFVDTVIICSITALAILCSGVWSSGLSASALTIEAFKSSYGTAGVVMIGIVSLLFGMTTTTGWYQYYCSLIEHGFLNNPVLKRRVLLAFKWIYPWPNLIFLVLLVIYNVSPSALWALKDIVTVFPTFFNVIAMFLLGDVFIKLLKDYKARYLGIGKVDKNFKIFYDQNDTEKSISVDKNV